MSSRSFPSRILYDPNTLLSNKGPELIHEIVIYGSKAGDPFNDGRFGEDQRRAELTLYYHLPRSGMTRDDIVEFARQFMGLQWPDLKHTQFWHCEFCGACLAMVTNNY